MKDTSRPTVVHIHTQKGKGYAPAEADREEFHWEMPFDLETGKPKVDCSGMEDYHSLTGKFLLEKMKEVTQPWNVSTLAQAAGIAALKEKEYVARPQN